MKELQQYFTEKNILTIFFPGLLATYPLWLVFLLQLKDSAEALDQLQGIITPLGVVLGVLLFIGIYGIGYFIKRMAIRTLEWHLDNGVERKVLAAEQEDREAIKKGQPIDHSLSTFNKTWYDYLQCNYGNDGAPLIIDYYDTYIYTYYFQLTCIVAIIIQLALIWSFELCCYSLFGSFARLIISVVSVILVALLYIQSRDSAWEAHTLRGYIVGLNRSAVDDKKNEAATLGSKMRRATDDDADEDESINVPGE
jgi:hypothetical protein